MEQAPAVAEVEQDALNLTDEVVTQAAEVVDERKTEALTLEQKIDRGVRSWLAAHLHNTAFSQDTGAWNVLQAALHHLASAIIEEVK